MTTIVRVKRHRADDPVEALVLSCKRKKTDDDDSGHDFKKVLNFSGTVEDKDDKVATSTVESFKSQESKYLNLKKTHTPEIRSKQRQERRERSEENRFTLLSCLRSSNAAGNSEVDDLTDVKDNYTIVDVSKESKEAPIEQDTSEGSYVYDLYSIQETDADFSDLYIENLLSIQPLEPLEYRYGEDCYDEIDPDEDDSNDENNWRNDYPETESSNEGDEDMLAKQIRVFHLDSDEYDLSGDSGEEEYLNYDDDQLYHYREAEKLGGKRYARYKANAILQAVDRDDDDDGSESEDDFRDCEVLSYHENSD